MMAEAAADQAAPRRRRAAWRTGSGTAAKISGGVLLLVIVIAVFAPYIAPHPPNIGELSQILLPPAWMKAAAGATSLAPTRLAVTSCPGSSTAPGSHCLLAL